MQPSSLFLKLIVLSFRWKIIGSMALHIEPTLIPCVRARPNFWGALRSAANCLGRAVTVLSRLGYTYIFHLLSMFLNKIRAAEREGQMGQFFSRASGSRGPHQLISTFVFVASLYVIKETPNRSTQQG